MENDAFFIKLNEQRTLFYRCIDTFKDIEYLQEADVQAQSALISLEPWNIQLYNVQGLMWRYLILELYKLYSKSKENDRFRLRGTIESLLIDHRSPLFKDKVSLATLKKYRKILDGNEFDGHYINLKNARHNYIAHTAPDLRDVYVSNTAIKFFLELAQNIFSDIIDPITNGGVSIYGENPSAFHSLIAEMVKYKSVYEKVEVAIDNHYSHKKKLSDSTIKDLLEILGRGNFIEGGIGK